MTSHKEEGKKPFELLLVAPPYLMQDAAYAPLFPALKPVALQESDGVVRFEDKATGLALGDISRLAHRNFNHAFLAAEADAALIIVDGAFGLEKRDLWARALACLAAVPEVVIAIDNMALADFSQTHFNSLRDEFEDSAIELDCKNLHVVPVDIAGGDNLLEASQNMPWFEGAALLPLVEKLRLAPRREPVVADPGENSDQFAVHLCWLANKPMLPGRQYIFDNGTQQIDANISSLKYRLNPESMEHQAAKRLFAGNIGYGNLSLEQAVAFAPFEEDRQSGSFELKDAKTNEVAAFGLIKHSLRRATNIRWQQVLVDKDARAQQKAQKPFVLWFTGLSGSGKSTIASIVEKQLYAMGLHTYLLDGDNVRHGLCRDLGFTEADRVENIRRIGELSRLMVDGGLIVVTSFISPFAAERRMAREMLGEGEFMEAFVDTPLSVCEERDIKGLYKKARAGLIKNFTGIDSPYERPEAAEFYIDGGAGSAEQLADDIITQLEERGLVHSSQSAD